MWMQCDDRSRDWIYGAIAKECQRLLAIPKAKRKTWNRFSLRVSSRNKSCQYLDFWFLASRTVRINFYCLSHQVCGTLLQQPWETSIGNRQNIMFWCQFFLVLSSTCDKVRFMHVYLFSNFWIAFLIFGYISYLCLQSQAI